MFLFNFAARRQQYQLIYRMSRVTGPHRWSWKIKLSKLIEDIIIIVILVEGHLIWSDFKQILYYSYSKVFALKLSFVA